MRVLVVGRGYIGRRFSEYSGCCIVDSYNEWVSHKFEGYDSVIFAAGIAHRKETAENKNLYFEVNRDLAVRVAEKAKNCGVSQFIYLSSMAIYGIVKGEIPTDLKPHGGHTSYSRSKHQAEALLENLADENFKVALVRPPMVYGSGCPGKFFLLLKLAKFMPAVPDTKNLRSMIYIDNLCEFLCGLVTKNIGGNFCPQNGEYVNTANLIKLIRRRMGRGTVVLPCLGIFVKWLSPLNGALQTAFGSLIYTPLSKEEYQKINLEESIEYIS